MNEKNRAVRNWALDNPKSSKLPASENAVRVGFTECKGSHYELIHFRDAISQKDYVIKQISMLALPNLEFLKNNQPINEWTTKNKQPIN